MTLIWTDCDPTPWYTGIFMREGEFKGTVQPYVIEYWSTLNCWVRPEGSCDFSTNENCTGQFRIHRVTKPLVLVAELIQRLIITSWERLRMHPH